MNFWQFITINICPTELQTYMNAATCDGIQVEQASNLLFTPENVRERPSSQAWKKMLNVLGIWIQFPTKVAEFSTICYLFLYFVKQIFTPNDKNFSGMRFSISPFFPGMFHIIYDVPLSHDRSLLNGYVTRRNSTQCCMKRLWRPHSYFSAMPRLENVS